MITKFLDPKNDFAFKRIFGSKKHKNLLISFLNAVLKSQISSPIQDLTFLKTIQDPEIAAKKQSTVDVMCQDQEGAYYIVEMQVASQAGFEARAQYYASKAYTSQMEAGDQYKDLKEIIFLAIADYIVFPKKKAYKSEHATLDRQTGENDLDKISFTFVELPKFKKLLRREGRRLEALKLEEKWYYFLIHAPVTTEKELGVLSGSLAIKEAYEALNYYGLSADERRGYELAEKNRLDELAIHDKLKEDATQQGRKEGIEIGKEKGREEGIEIGKEKGREEGIEIGKEEGIEIGKEKGREEGIEIGKEEGIEIGKEEGIEIGKEKGREEGIEIGKIAIAKSMLEAGEPIERIIKWTGLDKEAIEKLG